MESIIDILFLIESANARDLIGAANTATNQIKQLAQVTSVLGVIAGGFIMQIPGAGGFGRSVLISGLIGCLCAFGASAFVSLMRSIFGGI
jgi:hypothetical protein